MSRRRRTVRYHDWDEVRTEVEQLLAGGYEKGGNWSLGQICNHLAIVMEMAVDGFPKQMPRVVQALFRKLFLNTMVQHKVVKFRAPTPRFAKQDEPIDDEQGVERLRQAIERFCNSPEYVSHLVFGRITNDQWKEQQLWHCEHHLSFLHPKQVQGMENDAVLTTPAH